MYSDRNATMSGARLTRRGSAEEYLDPERGASTAETPERKGRGAGFHPTPIPSGNGRAPQSGFTTAVQAGWIAGRTPRGFHHRLLTWGLMIRLAFSSLIVLLALGGCSARSGPSTTPPTRAAPPPPPAPAPEPPPSSEPVPPPRDLPAAPDDTCVTIHTGECVPSPRFNAMATELAEDYAADRNFEAQWGLHAINAHVAYGNVNLLEGPDVAPGTGVTIGVIDTGIDAEHPIFEGKTIHQEFLFGAVGDTGEEGSHGTAVASIAAGGQNDNPNAAHGVAWGADLAVWAIPLGSPDNVYDPITIEELAESDEGFAEIFKSVFAWRDAGGDLDILNLSFGYEGIIDRYAEEDLRASFSEMIATLAQADAAEKTILVWAAGNQNGDRCGFGVEHCVDGRVEAVSVGILPGLLAYMEELQGHSIAVVALTPDGGGIASFSNRCGIASDFCIAAPGEEVRYAYYGPDDEVDGIRGYGEGGGTSFAAPMVSGGLAVMKHLFRDQLANEELVTRLFLTADNTGIYADRDIYGNGRMDLGAATSPVGVLDVPITTGLAAMAHASLNSTGLRFGAAFGDGFGEAFGDGELMALDDYGAPFWYGLNNFTATSDGPRDVGAPEDLPGAGIHARTGGGQRRRGRRRGRLGFERRDARDDGGPAPDAHRGRERTPRARRGRGDGERLRRGRPLGHCLHHRAAPPLHAGHRRGAGLAARRAPGGLHRGLDLGAGDDARQHGSRGVRQPLGRDRLLRL